MVSPQKQGADVPSALLGATGMLGVMVLPRARLLRALFPAVSAAAPGRGALLLSPADIREGDRYLQAETPVTPGWRDFPGCP